MSAIPRAVAAFFAVVLTVIAIDASIIARGLLNPGVTTGDGALLVRPGYASDRFAVEPDRAPLALPVNEARTEPAYQISPGPPRARTLARPVRDPIRPDRLVRREWSSGRDWKKTALVIGGSTAAASGLGAIFGGKKGALIGAAIGGGASALYESRQR